MDTQEILKYGINYLEELIENSGNDAEIEDAIKEKEALENELNKLTRKRKKMFGIF